MSFARCPWVSAAEAEEGVPGGCLTGSRNESPLARAAAAATALAVLFARVLVSAVEARARVFAPARSAAAWVAAVVAAVVVVEAEAVFAVGFVVEALAIDIGRAVWMAVVVVAAAGAEVVSRRDEAGVKPGGESGARLQGCRTFVAGRASAAVAAVVAAAAVAARTGVVTQATASAAATSP